jgi:DNA mismatch repair ATPase MutL
MAKKAAIQYGKELQHEEIELLLQHLFSLENYSFSPSGKIIVSELPFSDIEKLFKKR